MGDQASSGSNGVAVRISDDDDLNRKTLDSSPQGCFSITIPFMQKVITRLVMRSPPQLINQLMLACAQSNSTPA